MLRGEEQREKQRPLAGYTYNIVAGDLCPFENPAQNERGGVLYTRPTQETHEATTKKKKKKEKEEEKSR